MGTLEEFYTVFLTFMEAPFMGATRGVFLIAFLIALTFILLRGKLTNALLGAANATLKRFYGDWESRYSDPVRRPLRALFCLIGLGIAAGFIPGKITHSPYVLFTFKVMIIILVSYTLMRLEGFFSFLFRGLEKKMNVGRSVLLQQFSVRVYRFVLVIITVAVVLSQVGIDVGALVAGLGIAGLAFALAAQDTLSNVFAGITMIIDKPFDVGDRILSNGIDGIVVDINFRSTRLRTLEQEFVTLPNAKIAGEAIVNYTRRDMRKYQFILTFVIGTSKEEIVTLMNALEDFLEHAEGIDGTSIVVRFKGIGNSGLEVLVHYLTKDSDWANYLAINEQVHFYVLEAVENLSMKLAYPSSSIYFENALKTKGR